MDAESTTGETLGTARAQVSVFRREALGWSLCFRGRAVQVRHRKGMSYIGALLGKDGRCVHVLELSAQPSAHPAKDEVEKARKAVLAAIRNAIAEIASVHPELGRHLRASIATGTVCFYRPDQRVDWLVSDP